MTSHPNAAERLVVTPETRLANAPQSFPMLAELEAMEHDESGEALTQALQDWRSPHAVDDATPARDRYLTGLSLVDLGVLKDGTATGD